MKYTKQAIAFAMAFLLASAGVSQPIAFALPVFDASKSTVAYCSQPLKVPLGVGYDYQYFAYAAKVGSDDIFLNVDSGSVDSIENLYPGNHAWISGSQIRIEENTSFIIHSSSNLELKLSGNGLQLTPSESCDAMAAIFLLTHEYDKQNNIDKEDLTSAQIELVNAMSAAVATIAVQDVEGSGPSRLPSGAYDYDAATVVQWLENNGYVGPNFQSAYDAYLAAEEAKFPAISGMTQAEKMSYLLDAYDEKWLNDIGGKLTESQKNILQVFSDSLGDTKTIVGPMTREDVLSIIMNEKIYKHSSDPSKWLTMAEYLSKADETIGVEYKIVTKVDPFYEPFIGSDNHPYLQVFEKGTMTMIDELPILVETDQKTPTAGRIVHLASKPNRRIMFISVDSRALSLQYMPATIVHEATHETTFALGSDLKLLVGMDIESAKLGPEGLAVDKERMFLKEQENSGLTSVRVLKYAVQDFRLRSAQFATRVYEYGSGLYEFIRAKYGQNTIDEMEKGNLNLESLVDIQSIDSTLRATNFLPSILDEINAQSAEFLKIHNKEIEIKDLMIKDIKNPDIAKINGYINDLSAIQDELRVNPARVVEGDWASLDTYAGMLRATLEAYRDATPAERLDKYLKFMEFAVKEKSKVSNELALKISTNAKIYGGLVSGKVPPAEFAAVDAAATKVLEKAKIISQIEDILWEEKNLAALNSAEKSILKGKVPPEVEAPVQAAKLTASGITAIAAGTTAVFALGTKFVEYGQENNNPYLLYTGNAIEYAGLGLFIASAGATVANAMNIVLPPLLQGLVIAATPAFVLGTIIGLFTMFLVEMLWCMFVDIFGCMYIQPTLTLSATKAFPGEKITYEVKGFNIPDGVGDQEGKQWLMWGPQMQLGSGCTVSGDICAGEFDAPFVNSPIKVFAQDLNNQYRSASVVFGMLSSQLILTGTVGTDASYLCAYKDLWRGEPEVLLTCVAM